MKSRLEKLRLTLTEWLQRNGLDQDTHFYLQDEWQRRKENYLNDAEMVLVFEGDLFTLVNYETHYEAYDELIDLVEGFGYYFVLGHAWNMGFLPIEESNKGQVKRSASYPEKLRDQRWIEKRNKVRERASNSCEQCGKSEVTLDVHHCYYRYEWEPWEYPLDSLLCLCRECHQQRAAIEWRWRAFMPKLRVEELTALITYLDQQIFFHDREKLQETIELLKPHGDTSSYHLERFMGNNSKLEDSYPNKKI